MLFNSILETYFLHIPVLPIFFCLPLFFFFLSDLCKKTFFVPFWIPFSDLAFLIQSQNTGYYTYSQHRQCLKTEHFD